MMNRAILFQPCCGCGALLVFFELWVLPIVTQLEQLCSSLYDCEAVKVNLTTHEMRG